MVVAATRGPKKKFCTGPAQTPTKVIAMAKQTPSKRNERPEARKSQIKATPAEIRPPAGVCTGDYSKFPELAGRLHSKADPGASAAVDGVRNPQVTSQQASRQAPAPTVPAPLTGIVTENQLLAAMAAAPNGAILAADARLTPLAQDLARRYPDRVRRAKR